MGQWPRWLLPLLKVALPAADHKNDLEVLALVTHTRDTTGASSWDVWFGQHHDIQSTLFAQLWRK